MKLQAEWGEQSLRFWPLLRVTHLASPTEPPWGSTSLKDPPERDPIWLAFHLSRWSRWSRWRAANRVEGRKAKNIFRCISLVRLDWLCFWRYVCLALIALTGALVDLFLSRFISINFSGARSEWGTLAFCQSEWLKFVTAIKWPHVL